MHRGERLIKLGDSWFPAKSIDVKPWLKKYDRGRATDWARGLHRLPNPDKLRMLVNISGSEAAGAKIRGREGNNPE